MAGGNGRVISRKDIKDTMSRYLLIMEKLRKIVLSGSAPVDPDVRAFLSKDFNGFVFDRDLVTRYFEGPNPSDVLVVAMGAQPKDDPDSGMKENEMTVILVGCKEDPTSKDVTIQTEEDPGSEHPPGKLLINWP